jgi:hypothetical protein
MSAITPDLLVEGATCTMTMTRNGVTRTTTRSAATSASTTQCGTMRIPGSQLSNGRWQASVEFDSAKGVGISDPVTIAVAK